MYSKWVTGLPSKLSRVVPGRLFVNTCGVEGGIWVEEEFGGVSKRTRKDDNCTGFGALNFGYGGKGVEDGIG